MKKSFLTYVLFMLLVVLIQCDNEQQNKFVLIKSPQLVKTQLPTSFAVRSDDDILALEYKSDKSSQLIVYTDLLFKIKLNNYTENAVDSISYSDSGMYTTQGTVIQKYPFVKRFQVDAGLLTGNMVSISQKSKIVSVYNSTTKCPIVKVIKPFFSNQDYYIQYQTQQFNCNLYKPGFLKDLQNGMIAFQTSYIVYILEKKNISHVITKINITEYNSGISIDHIGTFYKFNTNQSMINIQSKPLNLLYILDQKTQTYKYTSQFDNYGISCRFYDMDTCLTFIKNKIVKIDNIRYQKVNHTYTTQNNPFQNITSLTVSDDSLKVAGYDNNKKQIVIKEVVGSNIFNTYKTISLINETFQCVTAVKFLRDDNQLLIEANNCKNDSTKLINICKLDIQLEQSYNCIGNNSLQTNHSSMVIVHELFSKLVSRLITIGWNYTSQLLTLKCLHIENQLTVDFQKNITFQSSKILNAKLLYHTKFGQQFALLVLTQTQTITKIFQLDIVDGKVVVIKETQKSTKSIPFKLSVSFNEHIVSFVQGNSSRNCVLQFYNWQLKQVSQNVTQFYQEQCYEINQKYRLLSQQGFNFLIVQRLFQTSSGYLVDLYHVDQVQAKLKLEISRRSVFSYYELNYVTPQTPFALSKQNLFVFPQSRTKSSLIIYNFTTVVPLFTAALNDFRWDSLYQFNYDTLLAYSSPFTNTKSETEIIAYTIFDSLFTIRDPTKTLIEIEKNSTPNQYLLKVQQQQFYPQKPGFAGLGKTLMASTKQHIISILPKVNADNSKQWVTVITQICQQHKGRMIWNITSESQQIFDVDISKTGYAFLLKKQKMKVQPFLYKDAAEDYNTGASSTFGRIKVTSDDQLFYTLKSSLKSQIYGLYKDSEMNRDYLNVNENLVIEKIQSISISPSGSIFLVETEKEIKCFIKTGKEIKITSKSKTDGFVDMFLIESDYDSTYNKAFATSTLQHEDVSTYKPQLPQFTIFIRSQNYSQLYTSDFNANKRMAQINMSTKYAISEKGGLLAYVTKSQNNTQTVHLLKVYSYGDIKSLDNITLTPGKLSDESDQPFTASAKDLTFSSQNTLCVLTQYTSSTQQQSLTFLLDNQIPPIIHMYSQSGCNLSNSYADGNYCKCLQNFTQTDTLSTDTKILEISNCECIKNFVLDEEEKCVCPVWQGFTFDGEKKECNCEDGEVEDAKDRPNVKVCIKTCRWWVWLMVGFGVLLIVYLAGCCYSHKQWQRRYGANGGNRQPKPKYWKFVASSFLYSCIKPSTKQSLIEQNQIQI